MGKRSNFPRRERDFYPTPNKAVEPLLRHLAPGTSYVEPAAGAGALIDALKPHGHRCALAIDIEPQRAGIIKRDLFDEWPECGVELFITNPPWPHKRMRGEPTISMIRHLTRFAPLWALLSAGFSYNEYFISSGLSRRCAKIVAVGRVSWMMNGKGGFDDAAWYLFGRFETEQTQFFGRAA